MARPDGAVALHPGRSGADQAANFIATTNLVAGIGLPPAVDLEFGGNCAHRPTVDAFEAELQVFLGPDGTLSRL